MRMIIFLLFLKYDFTYGLNPKSLQQAPKESVCVVMPSLVIVCLFPYKVWVPLKYHGVSSDIVAEDHKKMMAGRGSQIEFSMSSYAYTHFFECFVDVSF